MSLSSVPNSLMSALGRDVHTLLDRGSPARSPPVAGQGAHPDGQPRQPHQLRLIGSPSTTSSVTKKQQEIRLDTSSLEANAALSYLLSVSALSL
jgi:hypothetical protein